MIMLPVQWTVGLIFSWAENGCSRIVNMEQRQRRLKDNVTNIIISKFTASMTKGLKKVLEIKPNNHD